MRQGRERREAEGRGGLTSGHRTSRLERRRSSTRRERVGRVAVAGGQGSSGCLPRCRARVGPRSSGHGGERALHARNGRRRCHGGVCSVCSVCSRRASTAEETGDICRARAAAGRGWRCAGPPEIKRVHPIPAGRGFGGREANGGDWNGRPGTSKPGKGGRNSIRCWVTLLGHLLCTVPG